MNMLLVINNYYNNNYKFNIILEELTFMSIACLGDLFVFGFRISRLHQVL